MKRKFFYLAVACLVIIVGTAYFYFFSSFLRPGTGTYDLYIDRDDTIDSVYAKLSPAANKAPFNGLKTFIRQSHYKENIKTGRYQIEEGQGAFTIFRRLKNGQQTPVKLTIPSVRTLDRLAAELSEKLMLDSTEIADALFSDQVCQQYGYDTTTIACMFIPNTYEIYWNTSLDHFLERMQKEKDKFWEANQRKDKADAAGLTPNEVVTLASIVDEETSNNAEKPMIAGMYLNRLNLSSPEYPNGMPLQADPTVKFAWKKFELRRIYNKLLYIDSPYNTYRYPGLPPGPIRIPSVAGIDAVLNYTHHHYLYMCAKEDFSGTHNFAATYAEHLQNAAKYSKALNARGIK